MSENLARIMTTAAEENPDGIAVKLDDTEMSFALLEEGSARMAAILKDKGVGAGDRVGIMLPNVPYFPVVYYGVLRAGGVVVPMNPLLKGREVKYYLEDPGAKLLVAWGDFEEPATKGAEDAGVECILVKPGEFEKLLGEVEEPAHVLEDRDPDDTAVILYTSGTTGQPKGAELTHSNMYKNCTVAADHLGEVTKDDKLLGALPLFHSFGQTCTLNAAVHAQAMISMIPRFDPEKALEIIERDGITLFQGVPTMYNAMLHAPNKDDVDTSTLRVCMSGGSAMPEEVMRAFEKQFGCKVLEGYGLSETSPVASFNHPDKENKAGSIGTPIEGVEMKLVDDDGNEVPDGEVGEIAIKGHNIMKGYWEREEATAEAIKDGWFFSGDMGKRDEDGYYFIVDRKKELIIRGGYNVYPREIEEVLYEHPAVQEAAVIGVPHDELGEEVGAAIVLKDGEDVDADAIKAHVKEQVAAYKYPRQVWFVDELPKGPTGKILKREIEAPDAEARQEGVGRPDRAPPLTLEERGDVTATEEKGAPRPTAEQRRAPGRRHGHAADRVRRQGGLGRFLPESRSARRRPAGHPARPRGQAGAVGGRVGEDLGRAVGDRALEGRPPLQGPGVARQPAFHRLSQLYLLWAPRGRPADRRCGPGLAGRAPAALRRPQPGRCPGPHELPGRQSGGDQGHAGPRWSNLVEGTQKFVGTWPSRRGSPAWSTPRSSRSARTSP